MCLERNAQMWVITELSKVIAHKYLYFNVFIEHKVFNFIQQNHNIFLYKWNIRVIGQGCSGVRTSSVTLSTGWVKFKVSNLNILHINVKMEVWHLELNAPDFILILTEMLYNSLKKGLFIQ